MPNRANQPRGKQHGQENLEEVEEAGSNQAVDHSQGTCDTSSLGVSSSFIAGSAPKGTTRPEKRISNMNRAAADEATAHFETQLVERTS
jgi:hypothetical protein